MYRRQVSRSLDCANEGNRALVNQSLEVYIVDSWECLVEQIAGEGHDGDEVAVEEDCVQDS